MASIIYPSSVVLFYASTKIKELDLLGGTSVEAAAERKEVLDIITLCQMGRDINLTLSEIETLGILKAQKTKEV